MLPLPSEWPGARGSAVGWEGDDLEWTISGRLAVSCLDEVSEVSCEGGRGRGREGGGREGGREGGWVGGGGRDKCKSCALIRNNPSN